MYRVALYAGLAFVRATGTLIRMYGIILYQLNLPLSSSLLTIALEPYFEGLLINLDHCYYFIHLTGTVLISLLYAVATDRYIHLLYTVYVHVIVPSSPSLSLSLSLDLNILLLLARGSHFFFSFYYALL